MNSNERARIVEAARVLRSNIRDDDDASKVFSLSPTQRTAHQRALVGLQEVLGVRAAKALSIIEQHELDEKRIETEDLQIPLFDEKGRPIADFDESGKLCRKPGVTTSGPVPEVEPDDDEGIHPDDGEQMRLVETKSKLQLAVESGEVPAPVQTALTKAIELGQSKGQAIANVAKAQAINESLVEAFFAILLKRGLLRHLGGGKYAVGTAEIDAA